MVIELCAASIEAVQIAKKFNFDRIELCQNLEQGGLTPSSGLIEYALEQNVETHVLIRPRAGGFMYNQAEVDVMIKDIQQCKRINASGVVIGALTEKGDIDTKIISSMLQQAKGMQITFHRAFDESNDYKKSIDVLCEFGFHRILTSGLSKNVDEGFVTLQEVKEYANGRIEIMTGGGVNSSNVKQIVNEIQPDAVHFSGTKKVLVDEDSLFSESILIPNESKVAEILKQINR